MNTRTLIAAFATTLATLAAPAFASDVGGGFGATSASTLTRAEVRAALLQARAETSLPTGEDVFVAAPQGMAKTRAQVRAETLEAIRLGAISHSDRSEFVTAEQLQAIDAAGLRALPMQVAAR